MVDSEWIEAFLHYGYLPQSSEGRNGSVLKAVRAARVEGRVADDEETLIDRGIRSLAGCFREVPGGRQVVLLSGGLDSRAILAHLIEAGVGPDVVAITFGCPGTMDYEIGRSVAKAAGVEYRAIDLTAEEFSPQLLEDTVREGASWTYLFEAFLSRAVYRSLGKDCTYWTGFMGDPLAGSHLPRRVSGSWREACHRFARRNRFVLSLRATRGAFAPDSVLPKEPFLEPERLSYDEQLDFGVRQQCCIEPLVVPRGYDCRTPFLSGDWVEFTLSLPAELRRGQRLYRKILSRAHPHLFSLPTKSSFGLAEPAPRWRLAWRWLKLGLHKHLRQTVPLVRWPLYPLLNYLDFDEALRQEGSLRTIVRESLARLADRRVVPWLDIDSVWRRHQRRLANHADLLLTLSALEINLRVGRPALAQTPEGGGPVAAR